MSDHDGHSPATCNYRECHSAAGTPCPFVRDEHPAVKVLRELGPKLVQEELETKAQLFDELQDVLRRILEHE